MSDTVFKNVAYNLGTLIQQISMGTIGLPDIQRPFVWSNIKVRDLFDSMYRGYPVGYFLFWKSAESDGHKTIGADTKQKPPHLVIVDGQQRLTSLYAVIRNVAVLRENFQTERIQIAFNPLEERFDVADAAIRRDKAFIPDISVLWSDTSDLFEIVDNYLRNLSASRDVSDGDSKAIKKAISKLQNLLSFPLTALELESSVDEEAVSEVFVRINSKGTPLNEADFILTLMSVFWDEGRAALESFCREARKPSTNGASPFNRFITPYPDQLLRVAVGLGFRRARLKFVYSLLRGKDLETGEFSDDRRIQQFEVLRKAQDRVLNLQHWHDFMICVHQAGFRSSRMISSENNLLFTYILYLLGRTEYGVNPHDLRQVIARWFFMSAVTRRFTDSPESTLEFDLARLRSVRDASEFCRTLDRICDTSLTNDFWRTALPIELATSSPRSPSQFAYQAALVLLDAPALFSMVKVADLLDPAASAPHSAVERHHLFPKGYLATLGISDTRETNQIANFTFVEWSDNAAISDKAPHEYVPEMNSRFGAVDVQRMYHLHALPQDWTRLPYHEFLERRRELMAQVIAEGYATLLHGRSPEEVEPVFDLSQMVMEGESAAIEFKSTLRTNLHTGGVDSRMEFAVLRTLAGFLNTAGGSLVIGLGDDGAPVGIDADGFQNEDKMALHLTNLVRDRMGIPALTNLHLRFEDHRNRRVMIVRCNQSTRPVYVKDGNAERFFIRTGPSTTELSVSQSVEFIRDRFGR